MPCQNLSWPLATVRTAFSLPVSAAPGIVTMSAPISVAAHLEGKHCTSLDLTGIAVKNGAVSGHIRICNDSEHLHGARISAGGTDLLIGCDMIVASNREMMSKYDNTRTSAVLNEHVAPTYAFQVRPDLDLNTARMKRDLVESIGAERAVFVDANRLVSSLIGDTMLTNIFILGFTLQRGLLPVGADALERAVELNGVSIDANKRALNLGRLAAYDASALEHAIGARDPAEHADRHPKLSIRLSSSKSNTSSLTKMMPTLPATAPWSIKSLMPSARCCHRKTIWHERWRGITPSFLPTKTSTKSPVSTAAAVIGRHWHRSSQAITSFGSTWHRRCCKTPSRNR